MKFDELKKILEKQKVRKKPRHLESAIQQNCVRYFRLAYPNYIIIAVPNGGSRNSREAANLKREGVLAGASDLIVIAERAVCFVEMKYGKNKQTDAQIEFQKNVERLGHTYLVCYGLNEFKLKIKRWLKEKFGYETSV